MNFVAPVTEYGGFELALGSVFAVRWFKPDRYGRLHAINHNFIWKPGENVAKCQRDEDGWARLNYTMVKSFSAALNTHILGGTTAAAEPEKRSLSEEATEARVEVKHIVPMDSCGCGFYAFAEGCDDGGYVTESAVRGVIECYGRTILGTRGLRCEK